MAKAQFRPEQIIPMLREAEVEIGKGMTVREWLTRIAVQTLFITPGSPWENGYVESFNCRLKVFLKGDIFDTLQEAQILIEQWRVHYNTVRPHSSLGYRPPAPETVIPLLPSPLRYDGRRKV